MVTCTRNNAIEVELKKFQWAVARMVTCTSPSFGKGNVISFSGLSPGWSLVLIPNFENQIEEVSFSGLSPGWSLVPTCTIVYRI